MATNAWPTVKMLMWIARGHVRAAAIREEETTACVRKSISLYAEEMEKLTQTDAKQSVRMSESDARDHVHAVVMIKSFSEGDYSD